MPNAATLHVLERILAGTLRVDTTGAAPRVFSLHSRRGVWQEVRPGYDKRGRARFNFTVKRLPVYRNVLVWMWTNRRLPDGRVDHRDQNRLNDHPDNLQIHTRHESDRQGRDVQESKAFVRVAGWFGYIVFWGCEPDHELTPDEAADYATRNPNP